MKVADQQFFALLRLALGQEADPCLLEEPVDWKRIFQMVEEQSLVGVAFTGVMRLPKEMRPPKYILMDWYGQTEIIKTDYEEQLQKFPKIVDKLSESKLPYVLLKGLGVSLYYPEPAVRTCGDYDLWIPKDRQVVRAFAEKYGQKGHEVYHHIDAGEIEGVEVELHFTPSWMNNLFVNKRLQKWFEDALTSQMEEVQIGDCEVKVPSLAFNRVYLLLHIYGHLFNEGIGLRQVVDYYWVLMKSFNDPRLGEQEKAETVKRLKEFKLKTFAGALMWIMQEMFHLPKEKLLVEPNERRGRFLLNEIMLAGNFGHYDTRNTYDMYAPLHKRLRSRFKRDSRFFSQYPNEMLWTPVWRLKEWVMRGVRKG